MRIALYGGVANNLYVFAKALHAAGQEVRFVRDRFDTFPFSQPVWEDAPLTLTHDDLARGRFDAGRWTTIEGACGWTAPEWLYDPLSDTDTHRIGVGGSIPIRVPTSRQQRNDLCALERVLPDLERRLQVAVTSDARVAEGAAA